MASEERPALAEALGLQPHPEGGWYWETWSALVRVYPRGLPRLAGERHRHLLPSLPRPSLPQRGVCMAPVVPENAAHQNCSWNKFRP